jgi:hypothetical protein
MNFLGMQVYTDLFLRFDYLNSHLYLVYKIHLIFLGKNLKVP